MREGADMPHLDINTITREIQARGLQWRPQDNAIARLDDQAKRQLLGVVVDPQALAAEMAAAAPAAAPPARRASPPPSTGATTAATT